MDPIIPKQHHSQTNGNMDVKQPDDDDKKEEKTEEKKITITVSKVEAIDNSLGTYYKNLGRDDYYDHSGKGKFLLWVEDEGYDASGIDDELGDNAEATDCSALALDEDFPLDPTVSTNITENEKENEIFKVLQHCYKYNKPPQPNNINAKIAADPEEKKIAIDKPKTFTHPNTLRFKLNFRELENTKNEYCAQCTKIFGSVARADDSFNYGLSIGRVNNNIPFLKNMTDMFMRDRLKYVLRHNKDLSIPDWSRKYNRYTQKITENHGESITDKITSAMKSYIKRICPRFRLYPAVKIIDDIYEIAEYLTFAAHLINHVLADPSANAPFQFDFAIAVRECESALATKMEIPKLDQDIEELDDYNSADEDDPDAAHPDFQLPANEKQNMKYYDILGDVMQKLKSNDCKPYQEVIGANVKGKKFHLLPPIYNQWHRKLDNKHKEPHYPRKRRFCMLLDRRNYFQKDQIKTHDNNLTDSIIVYEPPSNCNKIPDGAHVPEWYFDSLVTCLIPRIGYNNGLNAKMSELQKKKETKYEHDIRRSISAEIPCNGGLITFSFHVEAQDEISCYMWWNCQCIRFMAQDIIDILPRIFDDKFVNPQTQRRNANFKQSQDAKELVQQFAIKDVQFEHWWKKSGNNLNDLRKYKQTRSVPPPY